jgi:Phage integrase SAM-like domain
MASLQARHSRTCASGKPWTPIDAAVEAGCSCAPTFYVVVREGRRLHRERVGKNRQQAERSLRKIGTQVDDGAFTPQKRIRFADWADQWRGSLEREPSTVTSYASTMNYAKATFGDRVVRQLSTEDVRRFVASMRKEGMSDSTRAKHLRVLIACLNSAVTHGYAARNVAAELPKGERPRPRKKESAYFENDELPRLVRQLPAGIYRILFLV